MNDYRDGFRQGLLDRKASVALDDAEHLAQWGWANDEWKEGWGDGYEQG